MKLDAELEVSVKELARDGKCSIGWIYRTLYEGSLAGKKIDGVWRIPQQAAAAFVQKRRCLKRGTSPQRAWRSRCRTAK